MSTLFKDIYESDEILKDDNRLKLKTTNNIYKLYFKYLQYSVGLFFRDCYKDLTDCINFSQSEYLFQANGTDNIFQLTSTPSNNSEFYVGYKSDPDALFTEVLPNNYTFNTSTNELTITSAILPINTIIYIVPFVIGQFNMDLDMDEINILAEGMNIPFLEEQQNRNSALTQKAMGGEVKLSGTQANHITAVHDVVKDQQELVSVMIRKYSYRASPNSLKGLGGVVL